MKLSSYGLLLAGVFVLTNACGGDDDDSSADGNAGSGPGPGTGGSGQAGPAANCSGRCSTKASACGLPSDLVPTYCQQLCDSSPTEAQLSCLEGKSCQELMNAGANALSLCPAGNQGTGGSGAGTGGSGAGTGGSSSGCKAERDCDDEGRVVTCDEKSGFPTTVTTPCDIGICKNGGECGYCDEKSDCVQPLVSCQCQDGQTINSGGSSFGDCSGGRCVNVPAAPSCGELCADHGGPA
jgi:hypothetical protein